MKKNIMSAALAAAVAGSVGVTDAGEYLSGDFHNHTTCSDGSTSVKTLTRQSLSYLDWFIHVGHSGNGARNCNISDFFYFSFSAPKHPGLWVNSLPNGSADIKGDYASTTIGGEQVQEMWRWQSLQEYNLPSIVEERESPQNKDKIAFLGLEWVVPGHEHASNSISTGNYDAVPNADAMAQFEYCFARNSDDTSMGGGQGWTCEISEENNAKLIELFANRPEEGVADYNSTLLGGINIDDAGEHVKSSAAVLWMQENFPGESFAVQAHVERQGAFIEDDDEGYNVEHMRDWNTLAPQVAFGFESQPGHQAQYSRGSYNAGRPTAGLYTFGGTGCYAAAEAAKPGEDFDGTPLTPNDFLAGGKYEVIDDNEDPAKVTLCRPGVRTMWDALLSEGRYFFSFASSDWHSRGSFGPMDFESTNDFYPGEYQEHFTWIDKYDIADDPAKGIIDSLRSGNSFHVQGQLVSGDMTFKACSKGKCAPMGDTLIVDKGAKVRVVLTVVDPKGKNNSKYDFHNPSLLQIGVEEPINEPSLRQVDLIKGVVSGPIEPSSSEYYNPMAPATTVIADSWDKHSWQELGRKGIKKKMVYTFKANEDGYLRARGSNIPAGTPNERDEYGNPLSDHLTDNIACEDEKCPTHLNGILTADAEAWADIWFHTNPIFIKVK